MSGHPFDTVPSMITRTGARLQRHNSPPPKINKYKNKMEILLQAKKMERREKFQEPNSKKFGFDFVCVRVGVRK